MVGCDGPDVICAGMPKAGTDWLFSQMDFHPDFWMPPIKELQYFNRVGNNDFPNEKTLGIIDTLRIDKSKIERDRKKQQRHPLDDRDVAFFDTASEMKERDLDFEMYKKLFRGKGDKLSGDITPAYAGLRPEVIAQITSALPDTKFVMLLREPVGRAWSHITMLCRRGLFDKSELTDVDRMMGILKRPKVDEVNFPTRCVEHWAKSTPPDRFRYFFFEDLVQNPDGLRDNILSFAGADPNKKSGDLDPGFNRKARERKFEISEPVKQSLVDYFRDELVRCSEAFGGHAAGWPKLYGLA